MFGTLYLDTLQDLERTLKQRRKQCRPKKHLLFSFQHKDHQQHYSTSTPRNSPQIVPKTVRFSGKIIQESALDGAANNRRSLSQLLGHGVVRIEIVGRPYPSAPRRVYDTDLVLLWKHIRNVRFLEEFVFENLTLQQERRLQQQQSQSDSNSTADSTKLQQELTRLGNSSSNLKSLEFKSCRLNDSVLNQVLTTLLDRNALPHLQHLGLQFVGLTMTQRTTINTCVEQIILTRTRSHILKSLTLPFYPTSNAIWKGLADATNLQSLTLWCLEDNLTDLDPLESLLKSSKTTLQHLELYLLDTTTTTTTTTTTHQSLNSHGLMRGLCKNTTLRSLHIVTKQLPDDNRTVTLSRRTLPPAPPQSTIMMLSDRLQMAMLPVLHHENYSLQQVRFSLWNGSIAETNVSSLVAPCSKKVVAVAGGVPVSECIAFYCHLNQVGRNSFLRGSKQKNGIAAIDQQLAVIIETASADEGRGEDWRSQWKNLSTLYYWLRMEPTLLAAAVAADAAAAAARTSTGPCNDA